MGGLVSTPADAATVRTPFGPFTVVACDGEVVAAGWSEDVAALLAPVAASLRPSDVRPRRELGAITRAVRAYGAGDLAAVDAVPVRQRSGPYLEHAWEVLRAIRPGAPVTYAQFAERCGSGPGPGSARAAAAACGRNAAALFVPCHRVARGDGGLGGFRWGLDVKRRLRAYEARAVRC